MGLIEACRGRQVYLDTNVFIHAVEGSPEHMPVLRPLFELLANGGHRRSRASLSAPRMIALHIAIR